ncbi:MAG: hypothetical protein LUD22_01420 [Coprobacillus sp.]|nr:hypothetical protein [Coprobacillus sp.]
MKKVKNVAFLSLLSVVALSSCGMPSGWKYLSDVGVGFDTEDCVMVVSTFIGRESNLLLDEKYDNLFSKTYTFLDQENIDFIFNEHVARISYNPKVDKKCVDLFTPYPRLSSTFYFLDGAHTLVTYDSHIEIDGELHNGYFYMKNDYYLTLDELQDNDSYVTQNNG